MGSTINANTSLPDASGKTSGSRSLEPLIREIKVVRMQLWFEKAEM